MVMNVHQSSFILDPTRLQYTCVYTASNKHHPSMYYWRLLVCETHNSFTMMYELTDTDHILTKTRYGYPRRPLVICAVVTVTVGLTLGLIIGRFGLCPGSEFGPASTQKNGVFLPGVSKQIIQDGDPSISDLLINSISSKNIRQYLK